MERQPLAPLVDEITEEGKPFVYREIDDGITRLSCPYFNVAICGKVKEEILLIKLKDLIKIARNKKGKTETAKKIIASADNSLLEIVDFREKYPFYMRPNLKFPF